MKTTGIHERAGKMPALSHFSAVFTAVLLLGSIYFFSPNFRLGSETLASPYAGDYLHEWIGGWIVSQGDVRQLYHLPYSLSLQHDPQLVGFSFDDARYLPMVYPPYYYVLVSPLSQCSFFTAVWIWTAIMLAAFVFVVYLLLREFPSPTNSVWLFPAACLFAPLIESLNSSQKGTALLLLFAGTFLLLKNQRPFAAGLLFGLLAMKPQLAVVIGLAMLWKREGWFVAGSAVSVAVCATSALILGFDVCQQYVEFSRHAADYIQTGGYTLNKSHSWYGFFALLGNSTGGAFVKLSTLVAVVGTFAVLGWSLRGKLETASPRFALQFAGLTLGSLLISPHLYTYDLTILLLPMCILLWPHVSEYVEAQNPAALQFHRVLVLLMFVAAGMAPAVAAATHLAIMPLIMFAGVVGIAWVCHQPQSATTSSLSQRDGGIANAWHPIPTSPQFREQS